ncbi:hypothetical protein BS78_04G226200 [Paspalum vaginatum]|nr:hypothetical protein BS78_04G226200 [Paspalum vaginatum]
MTQIRASTLDLIITCVRNAFIIKLVCCLFLLVHLLGLLMSWCPGRFLISLLGVTVHHDRRYAFGGSFGSRELHMACSWIFEGSHRRQHLTMRPRASDKKLSTSADV